MNTAFGEELLTFHMVGFVVQQGKTLPVCEPAGTIISIEALMESIRPVIQSVQLF